MTEWLPPTDAPPKPAWRRARRIALTVLLLVLGAAGWALLEALLWIGWTLGTA